MADGGLESQNPTPGMKEIWSNKKREIESEKKRERERGEGRCRICVLKENRDMRSKGLQKNTRNENEAYGQVRTRKPDC